MHDDAEEDLRQLRVTAAGAAYQILALLEQLAADPDLLDRLTQEDFESSADIRFSVDAVESLQRIGLNVWRLKIWTPSNDVIFYRVIYAYDKTTNDYSVLGVIRRDTDYEPEHPRLQRIIAAYEDLGLK
jgi:hypothetical protein